MLRPDSLTLDQESDSRIGAAIAAAIESAVKNVRADNNIAAAVIVADGCAAESFAAGATIQLNQIRRRSKRIFGAAIDAAIDDLIQEIVDARGESA